MMIATDSKDSKRIQLLNSPIDALTMDETLERVKQAIEENRQIHHTVVNARKYVLMQNDKELHESVINSDIINADGQAVVWASGILGKHLPERVAGIDLMQHLVKYAFRKNYKVFFFGAREEVVSKVVELYAEKYSKDIIAGYRNGYFEKDEESKIAEVIAKSGAQILFVAMGSPQKEIFINKYKNVFKNVNFIMGVGGSFDVVAGKVKRAPKWMQDRGFEWLYRLIQEPGKMWKRNLTANSQFIWLIMKEKLF